MCCFPSPNYYFSIVGLVTFLSLGVIVSSELEPFTSGTNCYFMGHSFFGPVARDFRDFAESNSNNEFPNSEIQVYQRGGQNGSPASLWRNDRNAIESDLSTGEVQLLGMTLHEGTVIEDFVNWINLALSYNPDTAFFIGLPWAGEGPRKETSEYVVEVEANGELVFASVEELREMYPSNAIYFLNYGKAAGKMMEMFDEDRLPDIQFLLGSTTNSIFRDENPGHQGLMLNDMAALVWLNVLYGVAPSNLAAYVPDYNSTSVLEITSHVIEFNEGYNDQNLTTRSPSATLSPVAAPPPEEPGNDMMARFLRRLRNFLRNLMRRR